MLFCKSSWLHQPPRHFPALSGLEAQQPWTLSPGLLKKTGQPFGFGFHWWSRTFWDQRFLAHEQESRACHTSWEGSCKSHSTVSLFWMCALPYWQASDPAPGFPFISKLLNYSSLFWLGPCLTSAKTPPCLSADWPWYFCLQAPTVYYQPEIIRATDGCLFPASESNTLGIDLGQDQTKFTGWTLEFRLLDPLSSLSSLGPKSLPGRCPI